MRRRLNWCNQAEGRSTTHRVLPKPEPCGAPRRAIFGVIPRLRRSRRAGEVRVAVHSGLAALLRRPPGARGHVMDGDPGRGPARARGQRDRGHCGPAEGRGRAARCGWPVAVRDPDITIVMDADYDATRPAWVLRDLPVEPVGRIRGDRVKHLPKPPRIDDRKGVRPPQNGLGTSVQHQHDHPERPSRHRPDQLLQEGPASLELAATGRQGVHGGLRSSIAGCREVMFGAVRLRPASGRGRAAGKSQRRDGSAPC